MMSLSFTRHAPPTTYVPGCGTEALIATSMVGRDYFQFHVEAMSDGHHAEVHIDREGAQALFDALSLALRQSGGEAVQ